MVNGYGVAPTAVAYDTQDARMGFVRKVYGLFFLSILTSVLTGWLSIQPAFIQTAWESHTILWLIGFAMIFAMGWGKSKPGLNMVLLYAFSAIMGVVVGPIFYIYQRIAPGVPLQAGVLATTVFGGLTLYVMLTRQDFNFLGGFLFVKPDCALLVAGIVMAVFHVAAMSTVYCVVSILIFSGYVLYDTSRIMTRLSYDQAAIGATGTVPRLSELGNAGLCACWAAADAARDVDRETRETNEKSAKSTVIEKAMQDDYDPAQPSFISLYLFFVCFACFAVHSSKGRRFRLVCGAGGRSARFP